MVKHESSTNVFKLNSKLLVDIHTYFYLRIAINVEKLGLPKPLHKKYKAFVRSKADLLTVHLYLLKTQIKGTNEKEKPISNTNLKPLTAVKIKTAKKEDKKAPPASTPKKVQVKPKRVTNPLC
jgi:hypothetical protein